MELKFFRVLKADPLGDPWTPNIAGAKPIQTFWCQFEGVEHPVQMSKQVPNTPSLTYGQFGYLVPAKSQKGTDYYKFKSQKAPDELEQPRYAAADAPASTTSTTKAEPHPSDQKDTPLWFAPYAIKINYIYDQMKQVDETPMTQEHVFSEAKKADTYDTVNPKDQYGGEKYGDKAISKEELEDIFGGPMAEPVELDK